MEVVNTANNGLSPEEIECITKDEKTFKMWIVNELIILKKELKALKNRWRILEYLFISVLTSFITYMLTNLFK